MAIKTKDGTIHDPAEVRLVGSVAKVRGRDIHEPAVIGEFPVFVERSGSYRMFTFNKKLVEV